MSEYYTNEVTRIPDNWLKIMGVIKPLDLSKELVDMMIQFFGSVVEPKNQEKHLFVWTKIEFFFFFSLKWKKKQTKRQMLN